MSLPTTRWRRLLAESKSREKELRAHLEITVYGSFQPDAEKRRLTDLAKAIRLEGFPSWGIVGSTLRPHINGINETCVFYLTCSDANLLVFTQRGKRLGVTDELAYILYHPEMRLRRQFCAIFNQISRRGYPALTTKQLEQIKDLGMTHVPFKTKKELHNNAIGTVHNLFKMQRLELQIRTPR
jgi:hypothetical protein